jgi:hypothetical protein
MLFATFDHHIPRSASSIESSGASNDEAISITKNPARELALMNAIGRPPALMDSRMSFGPVVDRLAANGIDLAKRPVEVTGAKAKEFFRGAVGSGQREASLGQRNDRQKELI